MARKTSRHWEHWIEVGRNTFQLVYYVINVISILAASSGLIFAYFNNLKWGLILIGVAVLCFAILYFYKQNLQEKGVTLTNPNLWIDEDQMWIRVFKDKRVVKHQYRLRALREVDRYRFKFRSGSEGVKIESELPPEDVLVQIPGSSNIAWSWQKYAILFSRPMKKGDTRQAALTYELTDSSVTFPFQTVSYAHVVGCSKLEVSLLFSEPFLPGSVYLTTYDQNWDVLERNLIPIALDSPERGIREYNFDLEPERGVKYRVEWQFND